MAYHALQHSLIFILSVCAMQAASGRLEPAEASGSSLIEGLKHKMLVHLFHKKKQEATAGKTEALKQFHYVFENYVNLLMWKVMDPVLLHVAATFAECEGPCSSSYSHATHLLTCDCRYHPSSTFIDQHATSVWC